MHLVGLTIDIYHDALSYKLQKHIRHLTFDRRKCINHNRAACTIQCLFLSLFQKGNQSHSPPQSAKSKFGSNLPFVWNDSGTESCVFFWSRRGPPTWPYWILHCGDENLSLVQARYKLNWSCLVPRQSVFWMNYPFHCSLIMYPYADMLYSLNQSLPPTEQLPCAYSACSHWELAQFATSLRACTIHNNKGIICRYTTFLVANAKQLFKVKYRITVT